MNDLFQDPEVDQNKDYLSELVGEGKKFKDTQSLARGKAESDNFIETLKHQLDELRTDYIKLSEESKARANIEELLNRRQTEQLETPITEERPVPPPKPKPEVDYDTLIDQKMEARERRVLEERNLSQTRDLLRERFGNEYQAKLRSAIDSVGLDTEYVNSLARRSPQAVFRLLGLEQTAEPFQTPPRQTNLESLLKGQPKRTWSYYQKMKRERPTEYHSAKTNVQMHQDAQTLGEGFFDAD